MTPLKAIFISTAGFESIVLALKKDQIGYSECTSEIEIRVEMDDILNIGGETEALIKDILRKTYSYDETQIEKTLKEYDYIIFF